MSLNSWQAIFAQSPVNRGYYDEQTLPHCTWEWPKGTWFQARRDSIRERRLGARGRGRALHMNLKENFGTFGLVKASKSF